MLTLLHVMSRPWAVSIDLAEAAHRLLELPEGFARGRALARLRAMEDDDAPARPSAAARAAARSGAAVAVIPIYGMLTQRGDVIDCQQTTSTTDVADAIRAAGADNGVSAIVLDVDSPGGEVFGISEAAAVIRDVRRTKPVVASANAFVASGAYWLASQADELLVTPSGQVGSIGVYTSHEDHSKALEAAGVKRTLISAGKYKVEGNPLEPLSDEARGARQAEVNRYYQMFVHDVARGRGVSVDTVRNGFGEGRMVGAKAAVEQGMANSVGTLDEAIRRAVALVSERRRSNGSAAAVLPAGDVPSAALPIPARTALPEHEVLRIAWHEAGHVVMAWLTGFQPISANVGRENFAGGFGATGIDWTSEQRPRLAALQGFTTAQRKALIYVAGRMSEVVGLGQTNSEQWGFSAAGPSACALAVFGDMATPDADSANALLVGSLSSFGAKSQTLASFRQVAHSALAARAYVVRVVAETLAAETTLDSYRLATMRNQLLPDAA